MRRILTAVVVVATVLSGTLYGTFLATAAASTTTTLTADTDTMVNGAFPDSSYGTDSELRVDDGNPKLTYVKFPVVTGTISSATLRVYGNTGNDPNLVDVYDIPAGSFNEATTYNTRPTLGVVQGSANAPSAGWMEVDVTAETRDAIADGAKPAFALVRNGSGADSKFSSMEGANPPQLVIVTGDSGGDTTPPDTSITSSPVTPDSDTTAHFQFTSTEAGSTFTCTLDGGAATACTSPKDYTGLSEGSHTFTVAATDAAGNTDPTPASYSWTVDTTKPVVTITDKPAATTTDTSATFSFSANEPTEQFLCTLDGQEDVCGSPSTYDSLAVGTHTFSVRADDLAFNYSDPVSYTWTIEAAGGGGGGTTTTETADTDTMVNGNSPTSSYSSQSDMRADDGAPKISYVKFPVVTQPVSSAVLRVYSRAGNDPLNVNVYDIPAGSFDNATTYNTRPTLGVVQASGTVPNGGWFEVDVTAETNDAVADGAKPAFALVRSGSGTDTVFDTMESSNVPELVVTTAGGGTGGDTTPPDTTITSNPPLNASSGSFSFTSTETGSTFECQLDGSAWSSCSSPYSYGPLADGSHNFQVRATDAAGNVDATPAGYNWAIDTAAPETTITDSPASSTTSTDASFSFSSSETGATFQCSLDGAAYTSCASPQAYSALSTGPHVFDVKATDANGNTDATPAEFDWTVTAVQPSTTKHFIANLKGDYSDPAQIGFNVMDVTPSTLSLLPPGTQGLVWLGEKCPTTADATFKSTIDSLASNPDVFGYYLSDEPHIADCPDGPAALKTRADYINQASGGTQQTMVLFSKQEDVQAFAPSVTDITLVGLDPYPCSVSNPQCDLSLIDNRVSWADAAGVARSQIVPVFQAFGQENATDYYYYNLPTAAEEQAMLDRWDSFVPNPVMDYAYAWAHQTVSNPTLVDSPELQQVFATRFGGTVPAPGSGDTTDPDTTISSQPPASTSDTSASFSFASSETGSTFQCRLDGAALESCTSPKVYSGLAVGSHTFAVMATDAAGNTDLTPATYTWSVTTATSGTATSKATVDTWVSSNVPDTSFGTDTAMHVSGTPKMSFVKFPVVSGTVSQATLRVYADPSASGETIDVYDQSPNASQVTDLMTYNTAPAAGAYQGSNSAIASAWMEVDVTAAVASAAAAGEHPAFELQRVASGADTKFLTADGGTAPELVITSTGGGTSDTTPPDTTITSEPAASTASTDASFAFTSTEADSSFQCSIDTADFVPCSSPQAYSSLTVGDHTFEVEATDASGNIDPTPAHYNWTITASADTTPPDTTITAHPASSTTGTSASFSFTSSESGSTFQCKLDSGSYASCTSPQSYSGLAVSSHTFSVRATDAAGNVDATPASYTWTITAPADTTPPDTSIDSNPPASTTSTDASFSFSSTESGSTFECKKDSGSYASCTSPKTYSGLSVGSHTFSVRATDAAGNTDASPASYAWDVVQAPANSQCLFTDAPVYWCTPLDASGPAPVDSRSDSWRSDTMANNPDSSMGLTDSTSWSQPIYDATCSDPLYHINPTLNGPAVDVHIPDGAQTAQGTDAQMSIQDFCTGQDVDIHHASKSGSTWTAEQVGRYYMNTGGLEESVFGGSPGNQGHRGLPTYARAVKLSDVQYAIDHGLPDIGHRLEAGWYDTGAGQTHAIWPMAGWEQRHNGGVQEGIVVRIKANVSAPAGMSAGEKIIFNTLKNYGAVIGDTGSKNTVKLQNYVNWGSVGVSSSSLSGVPWSDYEFVKAGYDPRTGTTH